jgi:hypothetical protein
MIQRNTTIEILFSIRRRSKVISNALLRCPIKPPPPPPLPPSPRNCLQVDRRAAVAIIMIDGPWVAVQMSEPVFCLVLQADTTAGPVACCNTLFAAFPKLLGQTRRRLMILNLLYLGFELFMGLFLRYPRALFSEKFERVLSSNPSLHPAKFEAGTSVTLVQLHQYPVRKK